MVLLRLKMKHFHIFKLSYIDNNNLTVNGSDIQKFEAGVNAGNSNITTTNVASSAANHELCHCVGLNDLWQVNYVSLMDQSHSGLTAGQ